MQQHRIIKEKVADFELTIYLPNSYAEGAKRYPAIYVQDGGNVVLNAFNYLDHLFITKQLPELIFVGITSHDRNYEYTPWPADTLVPGGVLFGGGANDYIQVLADQIKPYIDAHYATMPEPEHTAIAGCSFGGLVSAHAYYLRSDTFGKSAWLSASFWYEGYVKHMQETPLPAADHRLYMYVGELEGIHKTTIQAEMVAQTKAAYRILLDKGFPEQNVKFETDPLGTHDSFFFAMKFIHALRWLFAEGMEAEKREFARDRTRESNRETI